MTSSVFAGMWASYDNFFKKLFGDGERTQEGEGDEEARVEGGEKWPLLRGEGILGERKGQDMNIYWIW